MKTRRFMFRVSSTASLPLACASFAFRNMPAGAIAALLASQSAQAAAVSWDAGGGAGNTAWNYDAETFVNWSDDLTPAGDDVTFTATGAVSGSTTVTSTLDANYNINSLTVLNTAANNHNFDLNSKTLTVANGISFGYNSAGSATAAMLATMKTGTLAMTAGNFLVGGSSGTTYQSYAATVDLTNLTALTAGNSSSIFGVGYYAASASSSLTWGASSLTLSGGTNTITASLLAVGYNPASDSNANNQKNGTLTLKGTTDIKATTISIARAKSSNSSILTSGSTAVTLHGTAGGTSAVNTFTVGGKGYSSTNNVTGKADFSGGSLSGVITTLNIAAGGASEAGAGSATGTFVTGTSGILDATTVQFGHNNTTTGNANAALDIRGGTFRFDTWNDGTSPGTRQLLLKAGTFSALNSTANTIAGLSTLQIGGTGNVTFGQTVTGTGGLNITSDAITLGAASNTVVVNVTTTLSGPISSTTNTLTLNGGSNLLTLSGSTSNLNTGLVTVTTGELHLNKTAGVNAIGGDLTVDGGGAILDAANQLSDSAVVTVSAGQFNVGTLTETVGAFNMSGGLLGGSTGTLTAATYGLSGGTVNANLGTGTLNVTGSSALNGTSAAGTVAISGGTLTLGVSGSIATSSSVSIAGGAVLDTSAKASFAFPAAQSYTLNVNGAGAGSCGSINAAGLDISAGVVVFNVIGTLDDAAYVLATHTGLTGSAFASVTPPAGYMIDYAYNGGTQIALVQTATGFSSWIDDFGLSLADQDPGDDPDNDGMANVLEYVLNGNPSASAPSILPALDASGSNFIFTFTRREESSDDTTQVFEYGSNLTGWTPVAITGTPGPEVTLGTPSGGSPNLQSVTITIPKGSNTSLFGRLKVSQ